MNFNVLGCVMVLVCSSGARKYDLDDIAQTLYKENFTVILYKFRRSPEYTEILVHKFKPFFTNFQDAMISNYIFYQNSMVAEIEQLLADQQPNVSKLRAIVKSKHKTTLRSPKKPSLAKRVKKTTKNKNHHRILRMDTQWAANVDSYSRFHTILPASKRNEFKELAFKYAGRYIASLYKSLGGKKENQNGIKSTQGVTPEDAEEEAPTTPANEHKEEIVEQETTIDQNVNEILEQIPTEDTNVRAKNDPQSNLKHFIQKARESLYINGNTTVNMETQGILEFVTRRNRGIIQTTEMTNKGGSPATFKQNYAIEVDFRAKKGQ